MKKKYRIKKSKEIEKIIKLRKSSANKYFVVYTTKDTTNENFRFAISVSKKLGKAHDRNKIKRRVKSIVDLNKNNINKNINFFIICRQGVQDIEYKVMSESLISLLKRNNIIINVEE